MKTKLDTKPVPLDHAAHLNSEGDWKRMDKSGGKEGNKKRARELPPEIIEQCAYFLNKFSDR